MSKKTRWKDSLPKADKDATLEGAAIFLIYALTSPVFSYEYVARAAAVIRKVRKEQGVKSWRIGVIDSPVLGGESNRELIWLALSEVAEGGFYIEQQRHDYVADSLRRAEACLREHWKRRQEAGETV